MTEILERDSIADELLDELLPEGVDWQRLVVRYPIPALLVAAVGGFFLGRSRGPELLSALSGFAASEFSRNIDHLFDRGE